MPSLVEFVIFLLLAGFAAHAICADTETHTYWSETWRGWHFYEDPEVESNSVTAEQPVSRPQTDMAPELSQFAQLQKRLESYRQIAIIRPTEYNVRRYMNLESQVVSQASKFADVAQRIAWSTPALDPTLQGRPVNAKALEVFDRQQSAQRVETLATLGKDHVLLFFFRSDCPYCHAFAPTLVALQSRYGLRVEAISIDGPGLPDFPTPRRDNGIAKTLNVAQVPAVFLANPFSGQISPVGFGILSESQLLERIQAVSQPGADETDVSFRMQ